MTEAEIIPPEAKPKRPAEFTEEIFEQICERMAGGEWLRKICDNDPEMPSRQTFLRWIEKDTGRQEKYARASRAMVDYWAEELLDIANETEKDTIIDEKGRRKCNHEWVANKRLHADNLKFLMSKIYPKRYGDRLPETVEQKSHEATLLELEAAKPAITVRWERDIIAPIHDDQGKIINAADPAALRRRIAELEERLGIKDGQPLPPKLLTYDPGLPERTRDQIIEGFVATVRRNIPTAEQRPPDEVISEVMADLEKLLQAKYAPASDAV
jgi:hypothetical protein